VHRPHFLENLSLLRLVFITVCGAQGIRSSIDLFAMWYIFYISGVIIDNSILEVLVLTKFSLECPMFC
jgi:hypothetical protein